MAKNSELRFAATVWLYPSDAAAWHFVTIPKAIGQTIKATYSKQRTGFGSLPVRVSVDHITWQTAIFPNKFSGSYILPIKKAVRSAAMIEVGDTIQATITICS